MYLIFDVDGTLIDSMTFWGGLMKDFLEKYQYMPSPEERVKFEALGNKDMAAYFHELFAHDMSPEEILEGFLEEADHAYHHIIPAKEDVVETIIALKEKGYKMAVSSSNDFRLVKGALSRLEIFDCFDEVFTQDTVGMEKDNPEYWRKCCEKLKVKPEDAILFDDALYALRTAKSIGMKVCGIHDGENNACDWAAIEKISDYDFCHIKNINLS